MSILRTALLPLTLLLTFAACAQTGGKPAVTETVTVTAKAPTPIAVTHLYEREASVLESVERIYTYAADGTGKRDFTVVADVRTGAAVKAWSIISTSFAANAEHVVVDYVRVRKPDGTVVVTPPGDAQEQAEPVTREAPFYSDLKSFQIPVRNLQAGDHVEYHLEILRTKPETPGHFWGTENLLSLSSNAVVLKEIVELHVPKDVYVQTWSPRHPPIVADTTTQHVLRWENKQLKPVAGRTREDLERDDPETRDIDSNGARFPAIAWSNFHTWAEVGAWYRGMEGSRIQPDDDIKAKVKDLEAGKSTDPDKARAVYGFVGPQIRYIGVAFGIGRFQPHEASDVLRNQYGDCKDKHTLQSAMLAAAGISSDAALIGADEAFSETLPSPGWFNHVITLAHIDGQPVWLDATAEVAPYRMLFPVLRGRRALVVPATGEAHLETTPESTPFPLEEKFTAIGTLDDKGVSHSKITMDLRSDSEIVFRQAVRSVTPAQWDELMQQISYRMSYAGKVTDAQFSRADDTSAPMHIEYSYEREKAGDWDTLRIIPQFPPIGIGDTDEKHPPLTPIELGSPQVQTAHTEMKLPAGWGVELPAPVHAKSAYVTLDKTYKFQNGAVIADRRLEVLKKEVPAAEWKTYHAWYKEASLDGETYIQLTRTGGSRAAASFNADAGALIAEVQQLEQAKQYDAAKAKLDEAKALNPHQAYLWSNYGYIAQQYGKANEAADDFKKEIAEHPEEDIPYRLLAFTQMQQRKQDDAIETLHKLLKVRPGDEYGVGTLSGLMMERKDFSGAEAALHSAIEATPDNFRLKLLLSNAYLKDGKRDQAKPLLLSMATDSTDPNVLNDAAYTLADESMDLPLADTASHRSLTLLEDSILSQSGSARDALARAQLQVALWDTIGWVLFREGKITDAEPWLRAAWSNGQSAETGLHLGQVLEKQGKPLEALVIFLLAQRGTSGSNNDTVGQRLADRIVALRKLPGGTGVGGGALETLRSFEVPMADGLAGTSGMVQFEIMPDSKIQSLRVIGENAKLESELPMMNTVQFDFDMPPGVKAPLLRQGGLNCHAGPDCQLVLVVPGRATPE